MEILTGAAIDARSAFEAMLVGKPVVCRSKNEGLIRNYSPIADFSADVFINPTIEFAIQAEINTKSIKPYIPALTTDVV